MPEQELGEPLLRAREVVPRVLERPGQVAGGLALVVGDPHLDDVLASIYFSPVSLNRRAVRAKAVSPVA
ncbi:hypothetical protein, partial [Collinsella aerofaciens]|uniref:hypothetical protein n=1 Tax=Collinsella aerofaciens TaxID=74426 RepID=UPI0031B6321B